MPTIAEHEVPCLTAGEKLSRDEFLRRWEAHPKIKQAELIRGVVYMPSPVGVEHGDTDGDVGTWLGLYHIATPGTKKGTNTTAFMLGDAPQADDHLRLLPEAGGRTWVEGKYLQGAPELAAEVSHSSAGYDLHSKLDLYQEAGVLEYVVVLMEEQEVRWHRLVDGVYQLLQPGSDGIWRSLVFPGLWLDGKALLAGDIVRVAAVAREGLASKEHADFVQLLAQRQITSSK